MFCYLEIPSRRRGTETDRRRPPPGCADVMVERNCFVAADAFAQAENVLHIIRVVVSIRRSEVVGRTANTRPKQQPYFVD